MTKILSTLFLTPFRALIYALLALYPLLFLAFFYSLRRFPPWILLALILALLFFISPIFPTSIRADMISYIGSPCVLL